MNGPRAAILLAALALSGLGGDARRSAPSDWYLKYEPLESPEATALLDAALALGHRLLGDPVQEVRKVQIRRSVPRDPGAGLRRDFQLTEVTDAAAGVFTIYLSARPGEVAFPGQLAHEAFHLFNARLRDVYVEGLNCVLAEDLLRERGLSWEPWLRHFREGRDPLYGAAYALVREMAEAAGREAVGRLLRYAVDSAAGRDRMEIDIDRWLASLDEGARVRAAAAIAARFEALETVRKARAPDLAFRHPAR